MEHGGRFEDGAVERFQGVSGNCVRCRRVRENLGGSQAGWLHALAGGFRVWVQCIGVGVWASRFYLLHGNTRAAMLLAVASNKPWP